MPEGEARTAGKTSTGTSVSSDGVGHGAGMECGGVLKPPVAQASTLWVPASTFSPS